VFDPAEVDKQVGCAGLLMAMMSLDPTITFTGLAPVVTAGDTRPADLQEPDNEPNRGPEPPVPSFAMAFAALFAIFRRSFA
jgi:hypothetical protein